MSSPDKRREQVTEKLQEITDMLDNVCFLQEGLVKSLSQYQKQRRPLTQIPAMYSVNIENILELLEIAQVLEGYLVKMFGPNLHDVKVADALKRLAVMENTLGRFSSQLEPGMESEKVVVPSTTITNINFLPQKDSKQEVVGDNGQSVVENSGYTRDLKFTRQRFGSKF